MANFYNIIPGIQSTAQHQIARSAAFMGIQDFSVDFDDLTVQTLGAWDLLGPGTIALDLTHGPGVWGIPNETGTFMVKNSPTVANGSLTPWHVAARVLLPTPFAPDDDFGIMLAHDDTLRNYVRVGTKWNFNKEHYMFEVMQDATITAQVLSDIFVDDTNFHDLEIWFDGQNVYGNVDDAEIKLVAPVASCPTTLLHPYHGVLFTNNVGGSMALVDWLYSAGGRTPT